MNQEDAEQTAFNTIMSARIVLILSGLQLEPTHERMEKLAIRLGFNTSFECMGVTDPEHICWALYVIETPTDNPIDLVRMPGWLVDGVHAVTNDCDFDFANVDPLAWTNNIEQVVAKMPKGLIDDATATLLAMVKESMDTAGELKMGILRESLKIKREYINELNRVSNTLH